VIPILGATPLTAILGSGVDPTNHEAVKAFIRAACGEGLSLLLIQPGTKAPADMRTVRQRNVDDKAAREAAQAEGRANYQRVRSASGLALASSDARVVLKYLDEYIKVYGADVAVNLAVEVGGSRLAVVDCDTAAQYQHFLTVSEAPPDLPPTVSTPGQRDSRTGEMVHSNGGHFYFTVPDDVELPTNLGALTWGGDDGFAVLWHRRYVLIPPSVRPEGSYEVTGRDYPLPDWLCDEIMERGHRRQVQATGMVSAESDISEAIDAWAESVSWASILEPLGWTPTPRSDNCGCDVWTAPGSHGSPKSATAHDSGCALGRYTETNAPLHIWSDHPGDPFEAWISEHGTSTVTKLQAVSLTQYDGVIGKAMDELGLIPDKSISLDLGVDVRANMNEGMDLGGMSEPLELPAPAPEPVNPQPVVEGELPDEVENPDPDVWVPENKGVPTIAPFSHWRDLPPPEFIIDGLLEHGGLSSIIGAPGTGKSTVALDMACHIATGHSWLGRRVLKTKVLYLPGEGLSGAVQRLRAWEIKHNSDLNNDLLLGGEIIRLGASREAWMELAGYIISKGIELVIFDTFARMALDIEENSATAVGKAVERFDQVRKMTNAGVMVVHHTAKGSTSARGSSALNGALESELLITAPERDEHAGKPLLLDTSKQKNAEQLDEPMELRMMNCAEVNAPYITGPTGDLDPFNGEVAFARPVPEPLVETAIRILTYVQRFPQQGVTRSEIAAGVHPDPYTLRARDVTRAWKLKVAEAVDRALQYQLIETLTGTASGGRYIPSDGTPERARGIAASEVITDMVIDNSD
jgi:hypothetical protein